MLGLVDRLFLWGRSCPLWYRVTLFTRILLAAGFIPTGMVKLLGHRFAQIPVDNPVGFFFEALYQSGGYWQFLGASQVLAGLLLLWPRMAHLGAALFLPIMANIVVITLSMPFAGTPFLTAPMLLAVIYLCLWDFHRFRPMLTERASGEEAFASSLPVHRLDGWEKVGFTVFAISTIGFFALTRGFVTGEFVSTLSIAGLVAGLVAGVFTLIRSVWTLTQLWRLNALNPK